MTKQERTFVETVWSYYKTHGRHNLPWRKTKNPYRIVVSEVMLQQTQVERVIPKYRAFLKLFPTVDALAQAPLGAVIIAWQGLGYNRRARMLHQCARAIMSHYGGKFPTTSSELMELPGIGRYTAGAVLAFAFNTATPFIETNIRSAYLHYFFKRKTATSDAEILLRIVQTLDHKRSREWYYALMDYGASIKKTFGNPNRQSKHYTKQSRFRGSDREIRGTILRLLAHGEHTKIAIHKALAFESVRIDEQLGVLVREAMIVKSKNQFILPS